jgi:hypothetical protein
MVGLRVKIKGCHSSFFSSSFSSFMAYLKNEKYLTLKEASAIFGYAPDYIGFLIRKENIKLPGRQPENQY